MEEYYNKYDIILEGKNPEEFKRHVAVQAGIKNELCWNKVAFREVFFVNVVHKKWDPRRENMHSMISVHGGARNGEGTEQLHCAL